MLVSVRLFWVAEWFFPSFEDFFVSIFRSQIVEWFFCKLAVSIGVLDFVGSNSVHVIVNPCLSSTVMFEIMF